MLKLLTSLLAALAVAATCLAQEKQFMVYRQIELPDYDKEDIFDAIHSLQRTTLDEMRDFRIWKSDIDTANMYNCSGYGVVKYKEKNFYFAG